MTRALPVLAVLALLVWGALRLASPRDDVEVRATLSAVAALVEGDTAGYARAVEPRAFRFPDDHGPHPEYRTEWWYFTGNLEAAEGRSFGFQLTFFRNALTPEPVERASEWNTNQLWMAHFALTDVEGRRHRAFERFARGAAGLAGGIADPFRVWLEDWEAVGGDPFHPLRLRARDDGWGIDLVLSEGKPPVFQGEEGLSRKGREPGNASYYFSHTRIPTEGWVEVEGERVRVTGLSWMDREWSTSALEPEHVGWDWFSLQLSDERELVFFELRRADGERDPLNHGALVEPDGSRILLESGDVVIEVLDRWESPRDGARYPSGWRLRVPARGIDLLVTPRVRDQEMMLTFRYWEGSVSAEGVGPDGPVEGLGFVELTGYGGEGRGRGG